MKKLSSLQHTATLLFLATTACVTHLNAAVITWAPATYVDPTVPSQVSTTGTNLRAYTFGGAGSQIPIVNGLQFTRFFDQAVDTTTNLAAQFSGAVDNTTPYRSMLNDANFASVPGPGTSSITLNSLTIGQQYQTQFWVADFRGNFGRSLTLAGVNSPTLLWAQTNQFDSGSYAIGTFTANATSQVISFTSANAQVNALTLNAIPEPSTFGMLGLAGAAVLLLRRRGASTAV